MKVKKKIAVTKLTKNGRAYSDAIRVKIIHEVKSGLLGFREASRKYGINRKSISEWIDKHNLVILLDENKPTSSLDMNETDQGKLFLLKIHELTKALEQSQLKVLALETMIEVAESDLNIKIRKKRGTKQS